MNITRNPATRVHTKLMATVFAAAAAFAIFASESGDSAAGAAGTPCAARVSGQARIISRPRPTERLKPSPVIRSPGQGWEWFTTVIAFVQNMHKIRYTTLLPDRANTVWCTQICAVYAHSL